MAAPRWLHRDDFTRFITTGTSLTDGVTELAHIDWQSVITSRDTGLMPCSSGENRVLGLAASIAAGIPVDLNSAQWNRPDRHQPSRPRNPPRQRPAPRSLVIGMII
jgi:hypothetical protein